MEFITKCLKTEDAYIRYRHSTFLNKCDKAIVFLNGRGEWIEKYQGLCSSLGEKLGAGILMIDHRGQGGSGGYRCHIDDYGTFVADIEAIFENELGEIPFTIIAQSMGALIALKGIIDERLKPISIAICSPFLALPDTIIPRVAAPHVATTLCRLGLAKTRIKRKGTATGFANNQQTHDYDRWQTITNSPYPSKPPTFGWIQASLRAINQIFTSPVPALPTLLLFGDKETIVGDQGFHHWINKARRERKKNLQIHKIPGAKHEILNEHREFRDPAISILISFLRQTFHQYFAAHGLCEHQTVAQDSTRR